MTDLVAAYDPIVDRPVVIVQSEPCPWCVFATPHAHGLSSLIVQFPAPVVPERAEPEEVDAWS